MTNPFAGWAAKAYPILHAAYQANKNHGVPEDWFAGLVAVECGRLDPKAKRFEAHVFDAVMRVRNGKKSAAFPGFSSGRLGRFIRDPRLKIEELEPLATSYGLGQIMGYHYINKWALPPDQFTNLSMNNSAKYTLAMMADGMGFARKLLDAQAAPDWGKYYEYLMRWWNTGSCTGQTHNADYVKNAALAQCAYKAVMEARK